MNITSFSSIALAMIMIKMIVLTVSSTVCKYLRGRMFTLSQSTDFYVSCGKGCKDSAIAVVVVVVSEDLSSFSDCY